MTKIVGSVTFLKRSSEPSTDGENSFVAVSTLSISEDLYNSIVFGDNMPSVSTMRQAKISKKDWNKMSPYGKLHLFYHCHAHDARVDAHKVELLKF